MVRRSLAVSLAGVLAAAPLAAQKLGDAVVPPSVAGYRPQGDDERGLWMEMEEAERELAASNFVIRDPALNAYLRHVLCRTVGEIRCGAARIVIVRTPFFNAGMAPNGLMLVWSGLLLRMRDEAALAAVLGHEFAHFEQRHQLKGFRDARAKTDAVAWLSFLPYGIGVAAGVAQIGSHFANSREMEREADLIGLRDMARAGYDPGAASQVWQQLRDEQDATAVERRRRSRKDKTGGFFATHPNSAERAADLAAEAAALGQGGGFRGAAEYRAALGAWWPALIDDQIKLNDLGATEFLLAGLAAGGGWTAALLYARAELYRARGREADIPKATDLYRQSLAAGPAIAEAQRGLGLALIRSGAVGEGRAALRAYLAVRPDAGDRAIIAALADAR